MKIIVLRLIVAAAISSAVHSNALTVDEAINLLKNTKPLPGANEEALAAGGNKATLPMAELYRRQIDAIDFVKSVKNAQFTAVLIPYLNYSRVSPGMVVGLTMGNVTEKYALDMWPAYAAILQMKDAADELEKYTVNRENPINYRLATFLILKRVNEDRFRMVASLLDVEFKGQKTVSTYLTYIESGTVFWGVLDIKDLTQK